MTSLTSLYDSPDGQDCLKKTYEGTMLGAKLGFLWSLPELILRIKPRTAAAMAGRVMYWTVPGAAVLGTFHATSCLLGDIRGKDQAANHMVAGAMSMFVLGARHGPKFALIAAVPASLLAGFVKQIKKDGHNIVCNGPVYKEVGPWWKGQRRWGPNKDIKEPTNY